ncbi:MAG: hypothetical protein ACHQFX_05255 [Chitinophagales bacterium]
MKKIFLSAVMLASVYALCAQEVTVYRATDVNTYSVPVVIQTNFQKAYPTATQVTWQPMSSDWWYATYKENNRLTIVYYNTQPYYLIRDENYKMSLPVLNTFVPEDVITNAVNTYGANLYSITATKPDASGNVMYQVTVIKDGTAETSTMNGAGVASNNL